MGLPMERPTWGKFLGPKARTATPAITTSSGTPNPNNALQVRALLLLVLILAFLERIELVAKKDKVEEDEE